MKRKTITLVIYMLVCISLVSVGFAAWVITGGDNTEASGNVSASTVTDGSIEIDHKTAGFINGNNSIMFGSPADVTATGSEYLTFTGSDKENLSVVYQFTVSSNSGNLADIQTLTATYTAPNGLSDEANGDSSLITNGYVSAVSFSCTVNDTAVKFSGNNNTSDEDALATGLKAALKALADTTGGSATVKITIAYSWGNAFDGVNPYYFYNFSDYETDCEQLRDEFPATPADGESWSELKSRALTALQALQSALPQDNAQTNDDERKPFSLVINISSRA